MEEFFPVPAVARYVENVSFALWVSYFLCFPHAEKPQNILISLYTRCDGKENNIDFGSQSPRNFTIQAMRIFPLLTSPTGSTLQDPKGPFSVRNAAMARDGTIEHCFAQQDHERPLWAPLAGNGQGIFNQKHIVFP